MSCRLRAKRRVRHTETKHSHLILSAHLHAQNVCLIRFTRFKHDRTATAAWHANPDHRVAVATRAHERTSCGEQHLLHALVGACSEKWSNLKFGSPFN